MSSLPRWSLDSIYRGFDSDEYREDMQRIAASCRALHARIEEEPEAGAGKAVWLAGVLEAYNSIIATFETLEAYAYARFSTDTRDEESVRGLAEVEEAGLPVRALAVTLKNRLAETVGERGLQEVLAADPGLGKYAYILNEMLEQQRHLMSPAEEALADDLGRSGGDAWEKLHEAISSTATAEWDSGTGERKSVTELRSLAFSADRSVRQRAFEKELEVWKQHETALAFALNGVKGTSITLNKRRSYSDSLEKSIAQSRITPAALDALITTMERSLPVFHTYLEQKAEALGLERLAFFDLFAPIRSNARVWTFEEARDFIVSAFTAFHPPMGTFAEEAFEARWIDALPREGKVGGAYCTGFPLRKESRVLCNFDGSLSSVSTVAHELGHAYHGHILRNEPALLADYPMTLAETASIFAETVIYNTALREAAPADRLVILESLLQDATQVIVDILSRFYFERELFARRERGDLMPADLCAAMTDAQRKAYGKGLDPDYLHPYMWAVKGHYYRPGLAFYNFPYAFGQLFGLGLYARYRQMGADFSSIYDALLLSTGSESAVDVTAEAGFDIEQCDFWQQGIDCIADYVDDFAATLQQVSR